MKPRCIALLWTVSGAASENGAQWCADDRLHACRGESWDGGACIATAGRDLDPPTAGAPDRDRTGTPRSVPIC